MNNVRNSYNILDNKLNVVGKNIKKARLNKNMSAQRLSDKLIMLGIDIHRQSIFKIEAGKRTVTDYELCTIAEILDTTPEKLLNEFSSYIKEEIKDIL